MNIKQFFHIFTFLFLGWLSTACTDDNQPSEPNTEKEEPSTPIELKPRYIWIDAAANFPDFANNRENIRRDLTLARQTGFTDIVVDIRPMTGDILFNSTHCDKVPSLNAWVGSTKTTIQRTASWDYLQAFIDEGHALGLKVHAGFNTMSGFHILYFLERVQFAKLFHKFFHT